MIYLPRQYHNRQYGVLQFLLWNRYWIIDNGNPIKGSLGGRRRMTMANETRAARHAQTEAAGRSARAAMSNAVRSNPVGAPGDAAENHRT